jgi:diguanylate cyclase (GGDEF)-like protein/PAS domain S-box-containing protein
MSNLAQSNWRSDLARFRTGGLTAHRRRPLHVLFVHRDAEVVENCVEALKKAQFLVSADFVLNVPQCAERLDSQSFDVVVAEYPCPSSKGSQALQVLKKKFQEIPLLFVASAEGSASTLQIAAEGSFDCVAREHIAQLPMAVRRALNEKKLREELEEARVALRHSQSLCRGLVDNPTYGIYRCDAGGAAIDVNQALVKMLGYESKQELLAANRSTAFLSCVGKCSSLVESSADAKQIEQLELGWKGKDGRALRVRLSGRGVYDHFGNLAGHEIIAVDVTEQRTLEDQLGHQASSDSLTGLSNRRRLFEVLHAEICRSKRTSREFSVVLLDLDGLQTINDQFGHRAGDRALCRLAQLLRDCSRSIDTAARHGGDEFALVLPETAKAEATLVAQRICELLRREAEEPGFSVSLGIASHPKDADTIGALLCAADKALYAMKDHRPKARRAGLKAIHNALHLQRREFNG